MVLNLLKNTKEAIEQDRVEQVSVLIESVLDQFEGRRRETEAATKLASRVSEYTETEENFDTIVESYFNAASDARQARLEIGQVLLGYIEGSKSKKVAIESIERTIDTETRLSNTIEDLSGVKIDVAIPPVLAIDVPNELEMQTTAPLSQDLVVRNLGGELAKDVTVSLQSHLSLEVSPPIIDELKPDEAVVTTLTGTAHTIGEYTVTVDVVAESARARAEIDIVVANRLMYLEAAIPQIQEVRNLVVDLKNHPPGTPPGNSGLNGIENKLRTAEKRVGKVLREIKNGTDSEEVGNQIKAITNLLQTVIKQSRALTGTQLTAGNAAFINRDTEAVIETLNRAIDAGQ